MASIRWEKYKHDLCTFRAESKHERRERQSSFFITKCDRCMRRYNTKKFVSQHFFVSAFLKSWLAGWLYGVALGSSLLFFSSTFSSRSFVRGHKSESNNKIFIRATDKDVVFTQLFCPARKGSHESWLRCDYPLILNNKIHPRDRSSGVFFSFFHFIFCNLLSWAAHKRTRIIKLNHCERRKNNKSPTSTAADFQSTAEEGDIMVACNMYRLPIPLSNSLPCCFPFWFQRFPFSLTRSPRSSRKSLILLPK